MSLSTVVGAIASIWRYPVKSMLGEELSETKVTQKGVFGDRLYALIDRDTGKVVSAKNPKKWAKMLDFRASLVESVENDQPTVKVIFPDGTSDTSSSVGLEQQLSEILGRSVRLEQAGSPKLLIEKYLPALDTTLQQDDIKDVSPLSTTFFDFASVHLLSTASLSRFQQLVPDSNFNALRFRPNFVLQLNDEDGFVEDRLVDKIIQIGDEVQMKVIAHTPRCVVTTLPQEDLPNDLDILRGTMRHNKGNLGIYASVMQGGVIHQGDLVCLQ